MPHPYEVAEAAADCGVRRLVLASSCPPGSARRDAAELVRAAVEATDLEFVVANGIFANRDCVADLEDTIQRLGYTPVDDAWPSQ